MTSARASRDGRRVALIDLDGVLFDLTQYEPEWDRIAGEVFTPLCGGDPDGWAKAQQAAWHHAVGLHWGRVEAHASTGDWPPARGWEHTLGDWVREGCRLQSVAAPPEGEGYAVGRRAMERFFDLTTGIYPGVGEALGRLAGRYELHMSSGNPAFFCERVLERLGVRAHVGEPFGSDLAGVYKGRYAAFYERILGSVEARAEEAVVIDDATVALDAARGLGAMTVQIGGDSDHDVVVGTFTAAVDRLLG